MKATLTIEGTGHFFNVGPIGSEEEYLKLQKQIQDGTWSKEDFCHPSVGTIDSFTCIDPMSATMFLFPKGKDNDVEYDDDYDDDEQNKEDEQDVEDDIESFSVSDIPLKNVEIITLQKDFKPPEHCWVYSEEIEGVFFVTELRLKQLENFDPKRLRITLQQEFFGPDLLYSFIVDATYNKNELDDVTYHEFRNDLKPHLGASPKLVVF